MPTTSNFKWIAIFFALVVVSVKTAKAQSVYQIGTIPSVNINLGLKKNWALNFKTESRALIKSGEFGAGSSKGPEYVLSDFSLIAVKKTGLSTNLGAGYLIRISKSQPVHRAIQQFSIVGKYPGFRLAHRFSTDQSFIPGADDDFNIKNIRFRLRYRATAELPLNGQSVDEKEFYLKLGNEYIYSWKDSDVNVEIRLAPLIGYNFTDTSKLEAGIDYRVDSFLNSAARNSFWFSLNWFFRI